MAQSELIQLTCLHPIQYADASRLSDSCDNIEHALRTLCCLAELERKSGINISEAINALYQRNEEHPSIKLLRQLEGNGPRYRMVMNNNAQKLRAVKNNSHHRATPSFFSPAPGASASAAAATHSRTPQPPPLAVSGGVSPSSATARPVTTSADGAAPAAAASSAARMDSSNTVSCSPLPVVPRNMIGEDEVAACWLPARAAC